MDRRRRFLRLLRSRAEVSESRAAPSSLSGVAKKYRRHRFGWSRSASIVSRRRAQSRPNRGSCEGAGVLLHGEAEALAEIPRRYLRRRGPPTDGNLNHPSLRTVALGRRLPAFRKPKLRPRPLIVRDGRARRGPARGGVRRRALGNRAWASREHGCSRRESLYCAHGLVVDTLLLRGQTCFVRRVR